MVGLHPMWPLDDGLEEPVSDTLERALEAPDTIVLVGEIDGVTFGFLVARVRSMLPQAGEEKIGSIILVYVDEDARQVGVGEAMLNEVMADLRRRGIAKFDAHVLPGHRLAKNFFESGGFSARSIVMHHSDEG